MNLHDEPAELDVAAGGQDGDGRSRGSGEEEDHPVRRPTDRTDQTFESGRTCQTGDTESTMFPHPRRPRSTEYNLPIIAPETLSPSSTGSPYQIVK
jgi:hypothetical protein